MTPIDEKFVSAVRRVEKRTARVAAAVIIDPAKPQHAGRPVLSATRPTFTNGHGATGCTAITPADFDALLRQLVALLNKESV